MTRIKKIIVGFSSFVLVAAVVVIPTVYLKKTAKTQTSAFETPSNMTISPITDTGSSITTNLTININGSVTVSILNSTSATATNSISTTATSKTPTTATNSTSATATNSTLATATNSTSATTTNSTSATVLSSTSVTATNNTSVNATSSTSATTLINTSAIATSSTSVAATNGTLAGITSSIAVSTTLSTAVNLTTTGATTTVATSSASTCQFVFQPMVPYSTNNDLGPYAAATGNFNNDSYLDIVVANYKNRSVGLLLGNGDGTFQAQNEFSVGNSTPLVIAVGDFNNDNQLDTVVLSMDFSNVVILLGNGDGTLQVKQNISTGSGTLPQTVSVGNFNQDNVLDIVVAILMTSTVGVYLGNGDGTFQGQISISIGTFTFPSGVAIGDFNHDNQSDLAVAANGNNKVYVLLGIGNGSFRAPKAFAAGASPSDINTADLNGDSYLDIAVLNSEDNNVGILLGNGNGTFRKQTTFAVGNSYDSFFFDIADLDNDGKLDIVVPNTDDFNIGILMGKGNGSFAAQKTFSTGNNSYPVAFGIGDFNGDHRLDLAVANYESNNVGILLGTC